MLSGWNIHERPSCVSNSKDIEDRALLPPVPGEVALPVSVEIQPAPPSESELEMVPA